MFIQDWEDGKDVWIQEGKMGGEGVAIKVQHEGSWQ